MWIYIVIPIVSMILFFAIWAISLKPPKSLIERGHTSRFEHLMWSFLLALVTNMLPIMLCIISYNTFHCEINDEKYSEIEKCQAQFPQLKIEIAQYLDDNKINNYEYNKIKVKYKELKSVNDYKSKNKLIEQVIE